MAQGSTAKWLYDERLRPKQATFSSGRRVEWSYGRGVNAKVTQDGRDLFTHWKSSSGRTERWTYPAGLVRQLNRNAFGQVVSSERNGEIVFQVGWGENGRLAQVQLGNTFIKPLRDESGVDSGVLISAPMKQGKTDAWLTTEWDRAGRPRLVKDESGLELALDYDEEGRLRATRRTLEDGSVAASAIAYDDAGRPALVEYPWGSDRITYSGEGLVATIERRRGEVTATTSFDGLGRPIRIVDFDGAATTWHRTATDGGSELNPIELPSGSRLAYSVGAGTRSRTATLGPLTVEWEVTSDGQASTIAWGPRQD